MTRKVNRRDSIYLHFLELLLISAVLAGVCYFLLDCTGEYAVDTFYSNSDYVERKNEKYVESLQAYVEKHQLTTKDSKKLTNWINKQKIISLQIFKDDILMYDSDYPDKEAIWEENIESNIYDWGNSYHITFSDGIATASIFGLYSYQLYTYATVIELIFSFLVFLGSVIMGIRKTMHYINQLSEEIGILESGNLDYEITIRGHDELTTLAQGLDDMRKSFRDQVRQEEHLVQTNRRMITEMSHDLRTPLTSIMLYMELLRKKKYKDDQQMQEFIDKIDQKTRQMKQLADNLFEYSLITSQIDVTMEEPESFEIVFYDLLSETCAYLEQRGFRITINFPWHDKNVSVNPDYITRIFDNITSNIIKYAEPSKPVQVQSEYRDGYVGFSFLNEIKGLTKKENSTNIGLKNVKNMMTKMKGKCEIQRKENQFQITLLFPCVVRR